MIKRLAWDSAFFGYEIGSLSIDGHGQQRRDNFENFQLVYVFSPDDFSLSYGHSKKMDEKVIYIKSLGHGLEKKAHPLEIERLNKKSLSEKEEGALLSLALESGRYSRFRKDPVLGKDFRKLYERWMRNVLESTSDEVFVYRSVEGICGMVTFSMSNRKAKIGLMAVKESFRNCGIGSLLLKSVVNEAEQKGGIEEVEVVTQIANAEAVRFYKKEGFQLRESIGVFHWYSSQLLDK